MYFKFYIYSENIIKQLQPYLVNYNKRLFVSINVFLSEKLPENKDKIISTISFNKKVNYSNKILSIGTPTLDNKNLYEIWEVEDKVSYQEHNRIYLSISKNLIFGHAVIDNNSSYNELKLKISEKYTNFFKISTEYNMKIVKIWHYIPKLLKNYSNEKTNYSLLCEARENVYKKNYKNNNFPAATVIGIKGDKILIYFIAALCNNYETLENKRQTSSYDYPQNIFLEKPMFSRAVKFISPGCINNILAVSGTASIKGYKSVHETEVIKQLNESIENYETFINPKNNNSNISRVYLSESQINKFPQIAEILDRKFNKNNYCLLEGDICREELLIELEGISNV